MNPNAIPVLYEQPQRQRYSALARPFTMACAPLAHVSVAGSLLAETSIAGATKAQISVAGTLLQKAGCK